MLLLESYSPYLLLVRCLHLMRILHIGTCKSALPGQVSFQSQIGHIGHTYDKGSLFAFGTSLTRLFNGFLTLKLQESSSSINLEQ